MSFSSLIISSISCLTVFYDFVNALVYGLHTDCFITKSKMPVRTLAPAIFAAMAVQVFNGTAILLIVIHVSLSTPLITTPHPHRPSVFVVPSQKPRTAFHFSVLPPLNRYLSLLLRAQGCQVVGLPVDVFSRNRRSVPVDTQFSLSNTNAVFSEYVQFSPCAFVPSRNAH